MKHLLKIIGAIVALMAFGAPAFAGGVTVKASVVREVETRDAHGFISRHVVSAGRVTPGDVVIYTMTLTNIDSKPAQSVVVGDGVPAGVAFVEIVSGEGAEYSIDRGAHFGALAALRVANAQGAMRPAQPSDVTSIRWKLTRAVPAGSAVQVSYRARVK